MIALEIIGDLFAGPGARDYLGEPVTIGAHMLQAGTLAVAAGAEDPLVAAALLHDIGHLTRERDDGSREGLGGSSPRASSAGDRHDEAGAQFLGEIVEDLIGFWVMWHLYGGFEGLQRFGMHQSTIWRKVARFRKVTGQHPDEFEMPGISIDPKAYWTAPGTKVGRHPR